MLRFKRWLLLLAGLFTLCSPVSAQQTIFNVPSADVTPKNKLFLQHEAQFRPWAPGRFLFNTEYTAVGIGHNTEVLATLYNVTSPPSNNIALGVGFKSAIPILQRRFPEQEYKLIVGEVVPISLEGNGVGNWTFVEVSGRVPKLRTRLTGGISTGTKQIFNANTVDFIGAYEHPLTKHITLMGDWFSGNIHQYGLLINGFSVSLPRNINLFVGYQIPNSKKSGRQAFVIEIAKTLP